MKKITNILITFFLLAVLFSCEEEEKTPIGGNIITVGTTTATTVLYTTAKVTSTVESSRGNKIIGYGHCWGIVSNPDVEGNKTTLGSLNNEKTFTSQLDQLSANTSYHIRPYLTTEYETIYGAETTIKTMDYAKPTVATSSISGVTPYQAISGGNISTDGGLSVSAMGVVWNTTSDPTITSNAGITNDGMGGSFISHMTSLLPGTTYYVRAYATNSKDTGYGEQVIFITKSITVPEITTANITEVSSTSAVCGGNVTNDGYQAVTVRGMVWSTTNNPTITSKIGITSDGNGIGTFVSQLSNLQPITTYYLRAYATNNVGTNYGNEISFTTKAAPTLASLTTHSPTNITDYSATWGGTITNDGNTEIIERGVCYSTSQNPTITDSKATATVGSGSFSVNVSGLSATTTYYLRAYATNSQGTAYGNEISFKTLETIVTDIDGNVYHTVTIGTQVWMVENLKTTKYNDGTSMPIVIYNGGDLTTGACCIYEDLEHNKTIYGALYNWYSVNTSKLAPKGWHVPTNDDWNTLINYLGGENIAGGKLKENDIVHWNSPNTGATNSSGFSALPGGMKSTPTWRSPIHYSWGYEYAYSKIGALGRWWSCTSASTNSAYILELDYNTSTSKLTNLGGKGTYFSVRCIKDN